MLVIVAELGPREVHTGEGVLIHQSLEQLGQTGIHGHAAFALGVLLVGGDLLVEVSPDILGEVLAATVGLASQHLMAQGYGYGGEGDWKVSAMTAIMKAMSEGQQGGTAFMEDYTYHLVKGQEYSLGAHMLEVCPSLAADKARIEVHPLGIGDREPPARLVFEGKAGSAIVVSLVDMGGRLRLICQDIECVKPIMDMPNLPVARVMWRAMPNLTTGVECWITAGGAHHTVLSYDVTAEQMKDWATMMDIEFVHITKDTTVEGLEQQLFLNDLAWKLK